MIRFRCEQCDSLLETDLSPGAVEECPECGRQLLVPEPRKPKYVLWTEDLHEARQEAADAEERKTRPPGLPKFVPNADPASAPARVVGSREQAFRMLETRSLSIRAIGWLFVALSVLLFITYTRRDVPTEQFFPMVAACGVLLVGGVLLVAVAHLLVGLRLMAMPADPEPQAVA